MGLVHAISNKLMGGFGVKFDDTYLSEYSILSLGKNRRNNSYKTDINTIDSGDYPDSKGMFHSSRRILPRKKKALGKKLTLRERIEQYNFNTSNY